MVESLSEDIVALAAKLSGEGADGRAGIRALLREIEDRFPGEIGRMTAGIDLQRAGVRLHA